MKLSIILPIYNEEKTVREIIERVKKVKLPNGFKKEIIAVDDGSTDASFKIAKKLIDGKKLIKHEVNNGKGAAIKSALLKATGDLIIIQDADLEYNPADIPILLRPFNSKSVKVVYGSRVLGKNKPSHWTFDIGGRLVTLITNLLYGTKITDEPTGYKVFRKEVLKGIKLNSKGFEFCPEVTAKVAKAGMKITEVPINYQPRPVSEKKIKWYDGLAAIYYLLKYRISD